ncbi:RDD family protein [Halostreptopolyspora alba]|uniref:RDD family protein n=2 Tax=Halostreptopolyspora alba TaxID=2487137 RepID=A0A3N0E1U7_9ACTN|nr:RDD family protein [Nocardiopsaceae bacterium YIM 96095]
MPESGPGSVPGFGRRFVGVLLDWLLSLAIVQGMTGSLTGPDPSAASGVALLIFAAMNIALLILFGTTLGKRIAGIGVVMTGERAFPWPIAMVVRTVALCLVVPAVIHDRDQRGLHDRAAGTVTRRY